MRSRLLRLRLQRRHHLGRAHRAQPFRRLRTRRAGPTSLMLPSADVGIIALTNGTMSGVPEALTAQFADLVQFGEVREPLVRAVQLQAAADERPGGLAGRCATGRRSQSGTTTVELRRHLPQRVLGTRRGVRTRRQAGARRSVRGDTFELTHRDGNVFTFTPVTENAPPGTISAATFDGAKLTLEYYDDEGVHQVISRPERCRGRPAGGRWPDQRCAHPGGAQRLGDRARQRVHPHQRDSRRAVRHRGGHRLTRSTGCSGC